MLFHPEALPDVRDRVYNREPFRVGAEGDGVAAQQRDDLVHKAVLFDKGDHHARGHYHGDEIGHIAGCLHQLFVAQVRYLVEQQRERYGDPEAEREVHQAERERVFNRRGK